MTNETTKPSITPNMKVAEFLKHYPELESVPINMAPAFAKLKNPVLRKTVARVATLGQAAAFSMIQLWNSSRSSRFD